MYGTLSDQLTFFICFTASYLVPYMEHVTLIHCQSRMHLNPLPVTAYSVGAQHSGTFIILEQLIPPDNEEIQPNFNGSNNFGTMKICSR